MPRRPLEVHIGDTVYPSIRAAATALGRSTANIAYHMKRGTLDKLLTHPPIHSGKAVPVKGYPSQKAYADALGVTVSAVSKSKRRGRLDAAAE